MDKNNNLKNIKKDIGINIKNINTKVEMGNNIFILIFGIIIFFIIYQIYLSVNISKVPHIGGGVKKNIDKILGNFK